MQLFVKDDQIVTTARDEADVTIPGCQIYYVPDGTPIREAPDKALLWSELGVSPEDSARYEARVKLSTSDNQMARVLEDLVACLIDKGVITLDELPEAARTKIAERTAWRGTVA